MIYMLTHYAFARYALIAGLITGVVAPLIGSFVVVRRLSIIADALAHITLSGVAFGILMGTLSRSLGLVDPVYYGTLFALVAALFIEKLRNVYRFYSELAIPIILSTGVGLGVVLIGLAHGFNVDLMGILFGNILSVTKADLIRIAVAGVVVIGTVFLLYKELVSLSFDEESSRLSGVPAGMINFIFSALIALVISVSMQIVGILLVSALITLPVASALRLAHSFQSLIAYSILFAELSVLLGMTASFYFDLATGGTIVLVAVTILLLILLASRLRQYARA